MEKLTNLAFSFLLFGTSIVMRLTAWRYPIYRQRLREKNVVAQIRVKEGPGRYFIIKDGKISSRAGIHPDPEVVVGFKSASLAVRTFTHPNDQLGRINAAKQFAMTLDGPEDKSLWFMFILEEMLQVRWRFGTEMGNGEIRYCNMANGGPLAVYVRTTRSFA